MLKVINRFIVITLILGSLSGCSGSTGHQPGNKFEKLVSNHTTFPSPDSPLSKTTRYDNRIRGIAQRSGSKAALNQILRDFEKPGSSLQDGEFGNRLELYQLVCSLLQKIGKVDKNIHYFRNSLNQAPESLQELLEQDAALSPVQRWRLVPVSSSGYHMQGRNGIYNLKFISADGFCEAVYNMDGILLTESNDPVNMGTFNYGAGIHEKNAHQKYDVAPYLKWGNTAASPQQGKTEIADSVRLVMKLFQENFSDVTRYRKRIMEHKSIKS